MKIKSISKAVLLFALLTSTSFAAGKNVNVEFRKGHSSAQYSGEIKGHGLNKPQKSTAGWLVARVSLMLAYAKTWHLKE